MARPGGQTDHHGAYWRFIIDSALECPDTWIAGAGEATSVWIPPGGTEMSAAQEERLGEFVVERLGPRADNWMELVTRFEAAHPRDEQHYYLTLLGTHPSHRGRGIGLRLLAHDLAIIDEQHLPCYLESSNPANDDRYARLGFEAIGAIEDPAGGPSVATMWRTAR